MSKLIDMTGWLMSEHGIPDSKIKVLYRAENNQEGKAMWVCQCMCGNEKTFIVKGTHLRSGTIKSCGCDKQKEKQTNKYDLTGEYGIGWTLNTNREFYFDLEDYDKIKNYCWYERLNAKRYYTLEAHVPGDGKKTVRMHRIIFGKNADHKNRNPFDNRKDNLRNASPSENAWNASLKSNNTSGYIGVSWNKKGNKWESYIKINYKVKKLGRFDDKEDAIRARLQAEAKYFGEFAPQRHLFKQYGITIQN